MSTPNFFSLPPELQRKVLVEFTSLEMYRFIRATPSPDPLNGVFQLITNHKNPSTLFEKHGVALPRVHIRDFDASRHRALINIVELVGLGTVNQKKLLSKISQTCNFIYTTTDADGFNDYIDVLDEEGVQEKITHEMVEDDDNSVDEEYDANMYEDELQRIRLQTFFQRFLPFSKILLCSDDIEVDMSVCPDLSNVTIVSDGTVVLEKASKGLPKLKKAIELGFHDPDQVLFEEYRGRLTDGSVKVLNIGDEYHNGLGSQLDRQRLESEVSMVLHQFHTVVNSALSSKFVELWLCDHPTDDPPLLENVFFFNTETVSIFFSSQAPLVSDVFFGTTGELVLNNFEDTCSLESASTLIRYVLQKASSLSSLHIVGLSPIQAILTDYRIHSASLKSLTLTVYYRNEYLGINTECTSFPNITTLIIDVSEGTHGGSCLEWFPKITAPYVDTLCIFIHYFSKWSNQALGQFIKQFPRTTDFTFQGDMPLMAREQMDMSEFYDLLSPISSRLVSLKLISMSLDFLIGCEAAQFPELRMLTVDDILFQLDTSFYRAFELNLDAPKLETLNFNVEVNGATIIRNLPSLKTIDVRRSPNKMVIENLPELVRFKSKHMARFGKQALTGHNLPKLQLVELPRRVGPGWKDEVCVPEFDETVNPSVEVVYVRPF